MRTEFVDEAATVDIRDRIVYFSWPDGSRMGMPLRACRVGAARLQKALQDYDARKAEVIPMRKRG